MKRNTVENSVFVAVVSVIVALMLATVVGANIFLDYADLRWGRAVVATVMVKYSLLAITLMMACYAITSAYLKLRLHFLERKRESLRVEAKNTLPNGGYRYSAVEPADLDDPRLKRIRAIPPKELSTSLRSYIETSEKIAETDDVLKNIVY